MHSSLRVERLEARIAPAVVIVNAHTATYTDVDGDHVTIKVSLGTLTAADFTTALSGAGDQLEIIDLSGGGFDGANLTLSVAKVAGGDGLANIGYINSTAHDLGAVTINGDLGRINAGSDSAAAPAIKSLSVRSLGRLDLDTQGGGGSLESDITGALGALTVRADMAQAFISDTGTNSKIGPVTIGGSLIGGPGAYDSGLITSTGDIGTVKIGHDVLGGLGSNSGGIQSGGKIAGLSIGGSLVSGAGVGTGGILSAGDMGAITIGHDVLGDSGFSAGFIHSGGKIASLAIGGSLIGGGGDFANGRISSAGDLGAVKIGHDVSGFIDCGASLGSVSIGGSLVGGTVNDGGEISSARDMGAVKIGHDVQGGSEDHTGFIHSGGKLAGVSIGGSLIGGSLSGGTINDSGEISSIGDMGAITIGHNVQGGMAGSSGFIQSGGKLAGVTIGGSLLGGTGDSSGEISSGGDLGAVKIGHDLRGGSIGFSTGSLTSSGYIDSGGKITSVTIGGSVISGSDYSTSGSLYANASIRAGDNIGSLTVKGSLIGNTTSNGASPVIISARGQAVPGRTTDMAIGAISIGHRVEYAQILAGYLTGGLVVGGVNGDAQIGAVKVGGDWAASDLVAGARNDYSTYGDANDYTIAASNPDIVAKISSITIGGQVFGTPDSVSAADHFGFVTEKIGAVKIGGAAIALPASASAPKAIGETADMTIHLVA